MLFLKNKHNQFVNQNTKLYCLKLCLAHGTLNGQSKVLVQWYSSTTSFLALTFLILLKNN